MSTIRPMLRTLGDAALRHRLFVVAWLCMIGMTMPIMAATSSPETAPLTVVDNHDRHVTLASPARRAITTAPHATELIYAAGAGDFLIGTTQGSNYPPAARSVPSIGHVLRPNLEIATVLQPDLLIAWQPFASDHLSDLMQRIGVPVFYSDPRTLTEIADAIQTLGQLFGTEAHADRTASELRQRLAILQERYANRQPVRVFIQAGEQPLYTLNRHSILSDAIRLCGGINIFDDLTPLAPQIALESVLVAQPDAIIIGAIDTEDADRQRRMWDRHGLSAARQGNVLSFDADTLYRPGPRLIDAAEQLCQALDRIRRPQ